MIILRTTCPDSRDYTSLHLHEERHAPPKATRFIITHHHGQLAHRLTVTLLTDRYSTSLLYRRGLPPKKSFAPGPEKLPLPGVKAMERRNPCRGVVGALPAAAAAAAAPSDVLVAGVFRPLPALCNVTAVPGRDSAVAVPVPVPVPVRGGGRNPSRTPSRKISSSICATTPASSYS